MDFGRRPGREDPLVRFQPVASRSVLGSSPRITRPSICWPQWLLGSSPRMTSKVRKGTENAKG